jgi:CheY-specific phosphatase CheX
MQSSTQEQLSSTFLEVVEQLTFMFGEVTPKDELEAEGTEFMAAAMKFHGDLEGELTVAVPEDITVEIAANILGLEPEEVEPEFMRRDALAEMLNVVCGHVIMALAGSDANFKLDAPRTGSVQEDEFNRIMLSEDFIGFMLDDNPVFLGLSLEK